MEVEEFDHVTRSAPCRKHEILSDMIFGVGEHPGRPVGLGHAVGCGHFYPDFFHNDLLSCCSYNPPLPLPVPLPLHLALPLPHSTSASISTSDSNSIYIYLCLCLYLQGGGGGTSLPGDSFDGENFATSRTPEACCYFLVGSGSFLLFPGGHFRNLPKFSPLPLPSPPPLHPKCRRLSESGS